MWTQVAWWYPGAEQGKPSLSLSRGKGGSSSHQPIPRAPVQAGGHCWGPLCAQTPQPTQSSEGCQGELCPGPEDAPTLTRSSTSAVPRGSNGAERLITHPGDIPPARPSPGAGVQHSGDNNALSLLTPTNARTPNTVPEREEERYSYPN